MAASGFTQWAQVHVHKAHRCGGECLVLVGCWGVLLQSGGREVGQQGGVLAVLTPVCHALNTTQPHPSQRSLTHSHNHIQTHHALSSPSLTPPTPTPYTLQADGCCCAG